MFSKAIFLSEFGILEKVDARDINRIWWEDCRIRVELRDGVVRTSTFGQTEDDAVRLETMRQQMIAGE